MAKGRRDCVCVVDLESRVVHLRAAGGCGLEPGESGVQWRGRDPSVLVADGFNLCDVCFRLEPDEEVVEVVVEREEAGVEEVVEPDEVGVEVNTD